MKHYLGFCLVLVTIALVAFAALRTCTAAADHTTASVRDAFATVLHIQPQITLNQQVIMTQTSPIAELAVVTKDELVTVGFDEHLELLAMQIPLTEKKVTADAAFRIKAGFDLREPYSVTVDPATHSLHAVMPHAKILSVEQVGDLAYHGEDAMLNRITDDERAKIVNNLNAAARADAEGSSLKADAEKQVTERLQEFMAHNGQSFDLKWADPPPGAPQS